MSALVFAAPAFRPGRDDLTNWQRFGLTWTGWDGSEWDLRSLRGGTVVTNEGLTGLHLPQFELQTSESPATSGRRRLDYRLAPRALTLPVYLWSDDGSPEWQLLYRRFFRSFHPLRAGTLTVTTGLGSRSIRCYLDASGDRSLVQDPAYQGFMRDTIQLTAEDPWWTGDPVVDGWENSEPQPFFGADGNLWVDSSTELALATIANPGDAPAWARWRVTAAEAPVVAHINAGGGALTTPSIPAGQTMVIDTDPAVGVAELDGVDVTGDVDPWDPREIPEGERVPLELELTGYGSVQLELVPRYFTAF